VQLYTYRGYFITSGNYYSGGKLEELTTGSGELLNRSLFWVHVGKDGVVIDDDGKPVGRSLQ
jgi:hypothetical protein